MTKIIKVGYGKINPIKLGANLPLVFIGGPCAIESYDHALFMAERIKKICDKVGIKLIYKSFDLVNSTPRIPLERNAPRISDH